MGNNNNSTTQGEQELSQALAAPTKDFRQFLKDEFSAQELEDLPLTLGESKHQVTKWIKEPKTISFLALEYFMKQWTINKDDWTATQKRVYLLQIIERYQLGFDSLTLRHYYIIQQYNSGWDHHSFREVLRIWAGSAKLFKLYLESLPQTLQCSKHQLALWIKHPASMPHREVVIFINRMSQLTGYNSDWPAHNKSMVEAQSWYAHFELGFDTISLRTVFKFLNHQKVSH